jgi:hypothetical protein
MAILQLRNMSRFAKLCQRESVLGKVNKLMTLYAWFRTDPSTSKMQLNDQ